MSKANDSTALQDFDFTDLGGNVQACVIDGEAILRVGLDSPIKASSSGKSMSLATATNIPIAAINGKISINAFRKPSTDEEKALCADAKAKKAAGPDKKESTRPSL
ncbi:MAG: hypothetical protein KAT00_09535 [Planctomycetes bacterium]|nr:hypothetical protein [Planctomycetota bacterium]